MNAKAILWALVAVRTAAQNYPYPMGSPGGQGVVGPNNSTGAAIVAAAGRHPNATHEVTFQRFVHNRQQTWTWRINVTTLAIPNDLQDLGKPSADYSEGWYTTNSQWQLEWPNSSNGSSQSLQSFLSNGNQTLYANFMSMNVPSSIFSGAGVPSDGSCAPILGSTCTNSIMEAVSAGMYPDFFDLDGCKDTFSKGLSTADGIIGASWTPVADGDPLEPNDTFFALTSEAFHAGNMSQYDSALTSLQILTLDFVPYSSQSISSPSVLCQIVDCKDCHGSSSAATPLRPLTVASWGVVAVSLLLVML